MKADFPPQFRSDAANVLSLLQAAPQVLAAEDRRNRIELRLLIDSGAGAVQHFCRNISTENREIETRLAAGVLRQQYSGCIGLLAGRATGRPDLEPVARTRRVAA